MTEIIQILLWPALACLVLTGIHAYLGLHVVERGVIFVDLSLAQVAALGATIAFLCGADLHGSTSYWVSLGFTVLGAGVFAMTRSHKSKIPQEAIIGIVYSVCAAAAVLVMDRLPEGAEHIKYILVGNLLAVTPHEVIKMALLYSFIGLLHWFWRKPFLTISQNHGSAFQTGYNVRLWDFLFYGTFGLVVTSSVAIAGVLLVFSFLIVPSVTAMLFSEKVGTRLGIGWFMGTAVSLLGMYGSYRLDSPTGATVVCTFGLVLLGVAFLRFLFKKGKAGHVLATIGGLFMLFGKAQAAVKVGEAAPDFTAPASDGTQVHLSDLVGKSPIVLYFYPKDDTPGCTTEACGLRDHFAAFRKLNATVFGISYDTVESHQQFIQKYNLPFRLLSDRNKAVARLYGANGVIFAKRMTFVIDKAGTIAWINPSVNPSKHSAELEEVLSRLR